MHGLQATPTALPAGKRRDPAGRAAGQSSAAPSRTWRPLLVWLHVLSSVSWMSQAIVMCTLLGISAASPAGELKRASAHIAELLDVTVLTSSANMSAFTGFALAATTTWGYFHHWWVATKFVITFAQLYLGIFVPARRPLRAGCSHSPSWSRSLISLSGSSSSTVHYPRCPSPSWPSLS